MTLAFLRVPNSKAQSGIEPPLFNHDADNWEIKKNQSYFYGGNFMHHMLEVSSY
jgi:hypothetical protein